MLGSLKTHDGLYPNTMGSNLSITALIAIVLICFVTSVIIGETLDKIPRAEPVRACRESRDFDGDVKTRVCGYEQRFGWPFTAHVSFEKDIHAVSIETASKTYRRTSLNQIAIPALVILLGWCAKTIYWNKKLEESRKLIK